jgi:serine/threonine protein kinase
MQNLGTLDNRYTILRLISNDADRNYYAGRDNENQNNYIIVIKVNNPGGNNNDFPANEINILNQLNALNNPFILRFINHGNGPLILQNEEPRDVAYLVFENADLNFSLYECVTLGGFQERQAKLIFKKILNGIRAIHNAGICHRDIKPSNILLDENYNPKIGDYYFACQNANNIQQFVGAINYMAPEIILHQPYDGIKSDIFSLGQLLFNLVTGRHGFKIAKENDPLYSLIRQQNYTEYWNRPEIAQLNLSDSFKNLFVKMVAFNPNERPTIDEILNSE